MTMSDKARRYLFGSADMNNDHKDWIGWHLCFADSFGINLGIEELEDIIFFEKLRFYCRKPTAVLWLMSFAWREIWRIMIPVEFFAYKHIVMSLFRLLLL